MLAVVLSMSSILFNQIKIVANVGNAISSLYAAETGLERARYVAKACPTCDLNYEGAFNGRIYSVKVEKNGGGSFISSTGFYRGIFRTVEFKK